MKKVMKKFNRALSIMLVAAMVLTMAPQTAMPVLAAEPEVEGQADVQPTDSTPAGDTTTNVDVEPSTDEDDTTTDTPADVTETDKVPETEQKEVTEGDEVTPVIETDVTDEEPSVKNDGDDVLEDDNSIQSNDVNSLEEAEKAKTTIALYEKDKDGNLTSGVSSAEVQFTEGCASEDGQTVREGSDITFVVIPNVGKKVKTVAYAVVDAEAEVTKDTQLAALTGDYKIEKSKLAADKKVVIAVETEDAAFTLSATGGTLSKVVPADNKKELKALTAAELKVAYNDASSITLTVGGLDKGAKYTAKAQIDSAEEFDLGAGTETTVPAADAKDGTEFTYRTYSIDATALKGVDGNSDQTVSITFTKIPAVTVTAVPAVCATGYSVTTQAVDNTKDEQKDYVAYLTSGSYDAGKEVVFAVAPTTAGANNKYEVDTVKVTLANTDETKNKDVTPSDVTKVFITGENAAETVVYAAKIPADIEAGYTLKIDVTTKIKKDDDAVVVKFDLPEQDKDKVTIKGGTTAANATVTPNQDIKFLKDASVTEYHFAVSVKEGYKLDKLEVTRTGKKADGKPADEQKADLIESEKKDGAAVYSKTGSALLKETITPKKSDGTDDTENQYEMTVDTVTVSIAVVPDGADEAKTVGFSSVSAVAGGIPCEFEVITDEDVTFDEEDGEASIAEDTAYLSFRVKADTEPVITVNCAESVQDNDVLEKLGANGGYYSYQIPAKNFAGTGGSVTIARATKTITAKVASGGTVGWEYESKDEYGDPVRQGTLANNATVTVDADETIVFTVDPRYSFIRPITSVTYKLGDGAEKTAEEGNGGVYEFAEKASDNMTVNVVCETDEKIWVNTSGGTKYVAPEQTVSVNYDEEITAELRDKDGTKLEIVNAMVYDGTALAKTKPTVVDNVAKFTVDDKEQELDLTVTLVKKKGAKVSFKIKSDKKVGGVSYIGLGEDKTVTLAADESVTLGVEATEGNVNRLLIAFFTGAITDESKAENAANTLSNADIDAEYYNGTLTITAKSVKTANANAGTIVLCRPNGSIIKDSAITVKTEAPFMTKEAVADYTKLGKVLGKHVTIEMTAEALKAVQSKKDNLSEDADAYYYVKVDTGKVAKPADYTGNDWTEVKAAIDVNLAPYTTDTGKKVSLGELIRDGGRKIQLIPDSVAPLALTFKVSVTPAQKLASDEEVTGTTWTSDEFSTTAPNYSDTLSLGKNKVTLQTGRDEDIFVATPVFSGSDRYEWVDVAIIDSTTGKPHTYASHFSANWNAKDKVVTVNAKNASAYCNNKKYYKNLAVKVTVYTEDSDYGVSAVKALGVESGIYNISLDVQKEIVYTGKKVTVNSAVTYNGGDKDYAPKKKAVVYSLENVGKALKDNVSVNPKSGKITLNKDIKLSDKVAENSFRVVAKANDYESNPKKDYVDVTVVESAEAFQEVALFEAGVDKWGNNDWSHARKVTETNVEVKDKTGQYSVAALKIGAKANRDGSYALED